MKAIVVSIKVQLADCLAQNKFLFKLAYLCDIFSELNKLNISVQRLDKNMLDASHKIATSNEKLSLWN